MRFGIVLAVLAAGFLAACAGLPGGGASSAALHVEPSVHAGARPLHRAGQPLRARVADFTDARRNSGSRKLGNIRATVRDMHGTELLLDRNVESLLTEVTRAQLAADGIVLVAPGSEADFTVDGAVKSFSLEVAGRDERSIAAEVTLRDAKHGSVIWAGLIADQDDRYAGVAGNSRATIGAYLEDGVANYASRLSAALREGLLKIYPDSVESAAAARLSAVPGVTTLQAPVPVSAPQPAAAPVKPAAAVGHFSVQTVPPRARVYVGDVYYGMAPLRLELPAGIATFSFKLNGYRSVTEKVSIRPGETTEFELTLDKQ
ncbi:MAG: PEGA domain-containing protein [Rhodocyclales bacterium]|nr:PEGA domain-containing protein [Rhodocyclales bacterium]